MPAHRSGSVQPSAQCIPQVGHTQSVWCRSTVHPHVTNRSDGRPGPLVVHRCPAGQPGGGTRTQPRGVRCHFDQSISRTIEQVYECCVISHVSACGVCAGQRRMSVAGRTVVLCPDRVNSAAGGGGDDGGARRGGPACPPGRRRPEQGTRRPRAPRPRLAFDHGPLVWADSSRGARPGVVACVRPGARVVDLGCVESFPLPGVAVGELAALLESCRSRTSPDTALVNAATAWQQVTRHGAGRQAAVIREIEARTPDALGAVPDELACALVCTTRAGQDLFLRAWGAGQHPAAGGRVGVGRDRGAQGRRDPRRSRHAAEPGAVDGGRRRRARAGRGPDRPAADATRARRRDRHRPGHRRAATRGGAERRGVFAGPRPGRDGPPDRLPARRRGDRGVHRDRRPRRARRRSTATTAPSTSAARTRSPTCSPRSWTGRPPPTGPRCPPGTGNGSPCRSPSPPAPCSVWTTSPAHLGSYGPIPAQVARELAQDATWRRVLTDPPPGRSAPWAPRPTGPAPT